MSSKVVSLLTQIKYKNDVRSRTFLQCLYYVPLFFVRSLSFILRWTYFRFVRFYLTHGKSLYIFTLFGISFTYYLCLKGTSPRTPPTSSSPHVDLSPCTLWSLHSHARQRIQPISETLTDSIMRFRETTRSIYKRYLFYKVIGLTQKFTKETDTLPT